MASTQSRWRELWRVAMDGIDGDGTRVCDLKQKFQAEDAATTAPGLPATSVNEPVVSTPAGEAAAAPATPDQHSVGSAGSGLKSAIRTLTSTAAKPPTPGASADAATSHAIEFSYQHLCAMPKFAFCFQDAPGLVVPMALESMFSMCLCFNCLVAV